MHFNCDQLDQIKWFWIGLDDDGWTIINILMLVPAKYRTISSSNSNRRKFNSHSKDSEDRTTQFRSRGPKDQRKFFDIDYIFSDPAPLKQHTHNNNPPNSSLRSSPFKKHRQFYESEPTHPSQQKNKNKHKGTLIKGNSHLAKFNLMFQQNSDHQSIHTRKNASSHMSRSTPMKETSKTIQIDSNMGGNLIMGVSFNGSMERSQRREERRKGRSRQGMRRVEIIDPQNRTIQDRLRKTLLQSPKFKNYCEKGAEWVKNALVMRNKQTIRIFRPWSPLHLQRDESFYHQEQQM